ncbi:NUDIX hydrolase [Peribacillus sp. SCS-155]|uniref:NUDIX hydrolase n=1 Tax=Peribacillus sedimenti TaxID=3115297 RepID=UPI00390582F8
MKTKNEIVLALKGIVLHDKKALILQRADHDEVGAGTWEFAGGKLEFGEDLESSLAREVYEETGLNINIEKLLYASTFQTGPARQVVVLKYVCSSDTNRVILSDEHKEFRWVSKAEAKILLAKGIIHDFDIHGVFSLEHWL